MDQQNLFGVPGGKRNRGPLGKSPQKSIMDKTIQPPDASTIHKSDTKSINEQGIMLSTGRSARGLADTTVVEENEDDKRRGLIEATRNDKMKSTNGGSEIGTRFNHS